MAKRIYAAIAVVLLLLIIAAAMNGDKLYAALLRMHGGAASH